MTMRKIASIVFAALFLVTATVYVTSCKKKKDDATPSDGLTSETNEAQSQWDDIHKISEDAIDTEGQQRLSGTSGTPTITNQTISQGSFIGQITVDYGTGILCNDGRTRKGQIIIKYTGKYRTAGTIIQSTTQNYYVNDKQIVGCRTVKNTNGTVFSVKDSGLPDSTGYAQVIYSDGQITTWKSDRTRSWTAGSSTVTDLTDDVYSISGTASGTAKDGTNYSMNISGLILKLDCYLTYYTFMPAGGTISITTTAGTRSVNYGNGITCDRTVTFTAVDGKSYELNL